MTRSTALGVAIFAATLNAFAVNTASASNDKPARAIEFGKARPPIGYVKFCASNPGECKGVAGSRDRVEMTEETLATLHEVNTFVNGKIAPISDQELYGEPERWALPTDAGDCEDYLLLKKQYLEKLGLPAAALRITVVLDENSEGHAILTVAAQDGDYILDNRNNDILRWNEVNYTFLKRQSAADPRQWVALVKERPARLQPQTSASNSR